jgi:hypothetical protein
MGHTRFLHLFGNSSRFVQGWVDRRFLKSKLLAAASVCTPLVPIPLELRLLDGEPNICGRRRRACWSGRALGLGLEPRVVAAGCAQLLG